MVLLQDLVNYCDELLVIDQFQDYCPNGLQVEGNSHINKLVSGVTASQALIDAAIEQKADALLVHHGFFWKGENPCVVGMKRSRLQTLLTNGVSLLAYHLPLDAHDSLGNNAQLGRLLGFAVRGGFGGGRGPDIALHGVLRAPMSPQQLSDHIAQQLGRVPLHVAGRGEHITKVAWCTGAAQSYIEQAVAQDVDAFISGEISEQTVHVAREMGIHYYSAGHHATERYGVKALGEHLADYFGIEHRFIDIENPV
ncbi:Nif3-like dinuclear metal center hexameric protein [Kaarinaea lacus]